ncbi:MAG: hypothetical protein JW881_11990 [Spirochaetales bacterium]|nr:hypothetical protein [Spirochaetales bacterium]
MKILYYTSGVTGSGRVVRGIAIANGLERRKQGTKRGGIAADFHVLSSCRLARLCDRFGISHTEIPPEGEDRLGPDAYRDSELFRAITGLAPDILLVDLLWFPLYFFIDSLSCTTIFLWHEVDEAFFTIDCRGGRRIVFDPCMFDRLVAIEPVEKPIGPGTEVNPLILRNRDEIFPRDRAVKELGVGDDKRNCLLAYNGHPGDFEKLKRMYSYLEDEGFRMVYTTNYRGGLFPVVDYFNAFDLIICGAGYNSFWETRFFEKEAVYYPPVTRFYDPGRLIRDYHDYTFSENGADQLADMLMSL